MTSFVWLDARVALEEAHTHTYRKVLQSVLQYSLRQTVQFSLTVWDSRLERLVVLLLLSTLLRRNNTDSALLYAMLLRIVVCCVVLRCSLLCSSGGGVEWVLLLGGAVCVLQQCVYCNVQCAMLLLNGFRSKV